MTTIVDASKSPDAQAPEAPKSDIWISQVDHVGTGRDIIFQNAEERKTGHFVHGVREIPGGLFEAYIRNTGRNWMQGRANWEHVTAWKLALPKGWDVKNGPFVGHRTGVELAGLSEVVILTTEDDLKVAQLRTKVSELMVERERPGADVVGLDAQIGVLNGRIEGLRAWCTPAEHKRYGGPMNQHIIEGESCISIVFGPVENLHEKPRASADLVAKFRQYLHIVNHDDTGNAALDQHRKSWTVHASVLDREGADDYAGGWITSPHLIFPWTYKAPRGRYFGSTASPDGQRGGGVNGRYWFAMWCLERAVIDNDLHAYNLALTVARHIATQGVLLPGDDPNDFSGYRRFEKASADCPGDADIAKPSHNFTEDVQWVAAFSGCPILGEAAETMRNTLLRQKTAWQRIYGSRGYDRQLSGLLVAQLITEDERYADHAQAISDKTMALVRPEENWFQDDARPHYELPSEEDAENNHHQESHTWQDAPCLYVMTQWMFLAKERGKTWLLNHQQKVQEMTAYLLEHAVKTEGRDTLAAYWGKPRRGEWEYPSWAVLVSFAYLPLFIIYAQYEPSARAKVKALLNTWLEIFPKQTAAKWTNHRNTPIKNQGQSMWAARPDLIRLALAWPE